MEWRLDFWHSDSARFYVNGTLLWMYYRKDKFRAAKDLTLIHE